MMILISQEYLTGWRRKGEINACKTKLGKRYIVLIAEKNEMWPHFTCWVYSKKLLLTLLLKIKICNDDALFEGAVCKDRSLTLCSSIRCTVAYKHLRKCGTCHNVSRSCAKYHTYCISLKWPKIKAIFFKLHFRHKSSKLKQ